MFVLSRAQNKIPIGKYGIMVSLYDRLGGHPMQWSKLGKGIITQFKTL